MAEPLYFADAQSFRAWLAAHAATASELLVGFHKVGSGQACMSWSDSVDEALCFGWIDGRRQRLSDTAYTIRFSPRKPSSIWSMVNIAKVERLRAEGRMRPAGEQAFAQRKEERSGIYSHERKTPAELSGAELEAFKRHPGAWEYFEATPPSYRKQLLHWVTSAKKEATRASRLSTLIEACAAGTRL